MSESPATSGNKQSRFWVPFVVGLILIGGAALVVMNRRLSQGSPVPRTVLVSQIQTDTSDSADAPQDVVEFTDGTKLDGVGYDLANVGVITLAQAAPVFFFKANSCRACEPEIRLIVYSTHDHSVWRFPYPGQHSLMGGDSDQEIPDFISSAVFGACGQPPARLILAQKSRSVESDGLNVHAEETWQFQTVTMTFSDDGHIEKSELPQDSFVELQRLSGGDCRSLEPEDRFDYL